MEKKQTMQAALNAYIEEKRKKRNQAIVALMMSILGLALWVIGAYILFMVDARVFLGIFLLIWANNIADTKKYKGKEDL